MEVPTCGLKWLMRECDTKLFGTIVFSKLSFLLKHVEMRVIILLVMLELYFSMELIMKKTNGRMKYMFIFFITRQRARVTRMQAGDALSSLHTITVDVEIC